MPLEVVVNNLIIPSDGLKLAGTLVHPAGEPSPKTAVVFMHGASKPKGPGRIYFSEPQQSLAEVGIPSIAVDCRGVGDSEGDYYDGNLANRIADCEAGLKVLRQNTYVHPRKLVLIGDSMGAVPAVRLARYYSSSVIAVMLINPAAYSVRSEKLSRHNSPIDGISDFTREIRQEKSFRDSRTFKDLSFLKMPITIYKSLIDGQIPDEVHELYIRSISPETTLTIQELPINHHFILSRDDEETRAARQFLWQNIYTRLKDSLI